MRHYCTYFDMNYLAKGLALLHSLERHSKGAYCVHVVCLDELTRILLGRLALPNVELISLHVLERGDAALAHARATRQRVEYYWTLTPTIITRIFEWHPEADLLTYLDADLFFYSSPEAIFKELGEKSILIHSHRFTPALKQLEMNGIYNVGLLVFRRDVNGLEALDWWRSRCNEWCFNKFEDNKMGDQKYLDDWPTRFKGVVVLQHLGAGLGPWNHDQYDYSENADGSATVDSVPVVFYHFHSLDAVAPGVFVPSRYVHYPMTDAVLQICYLPYLEELVRSMNDLEKIQHSLHCGLTNRIYNEMIFLARVEVKDSLANFLASHITLDFKGGWQCYLPKQTRQPIKFSQDSLPESIKGTAQKTIQPVAFSERSLSPGARAIIDALQQEGAAEGPDAERLEQEAHAFLDDEMYHREVTSALIAFQERLYQRWLKESLILDTNYRKRPYEISVIVSTYKSGAFMAECLQDLTSQTVGEALEIVIVDADSPENERAVVEDFQKRFTNIRYVRTPKRIGIYPAWNLAMYHSCGEYLTPFSTNDRLRPDAYEMMLRYLKNHPATALVYGDTHLTSQPHQTYQKYVPLRNGSDFRWPPFNYYQLLFNCMVGPHPMWRRFLHREVGYFDPRYSAIADQDYWLRTGKFFTIEHIPEFTGLQWIADESLSSRPTGQMEIFDIQRRHQRAWLKERGAEYSSVEMSAILSLFMLIMIRLIESKNLSHVLDFWERHHAIFPAVPQIVQIGELVEKVRKLTGSTVR